jgi:hypothetical protein
MRTRGTVFHDKEPITLTYADDKTTLSGERDGVRVDNIYIGDVRPDGCDVLAHGTVKDLVGYASRIVITLSSGNAGGCNRPRQLLRRAQERFGFRLYPVFQDGQETAVYTISGLTLSAIAYLRSKLGVWIASLQETTIRLPGNGSVEHIARKPKRKGSSYHPDYRRSNAGKAVRHVHKEEMRMI